ncbi:hypothetical protein [Flavobacterium sp. LM4]|nr:hypothetical protein [Flavobacterium sp. LM4]
MEDTAVAFMSTETVSGNQTKVKWVISGCDTLSNKYYASNDENG